MLRTRFANNIYYKLSLEAGRATIDISLRNSRLILLGFQSLDGMGDSV